MKEWDYSKGGLRFKGRGLDRFQTKMALKIFVDEIKEDLHPEEFVKLLDEQ